jgi:CRP/FNR family transcriptional regulator, anaerobic regulatory protein
VTKLESIFPKVDCLHCRLAEACFPYGLKQEEISQFETIVKRKKPRKPNEYLYRQEDQSHSLFIVKSGSFRSFISDKNGGEQTIGFYLPGELMGLDALQYSGRFHCSVVALETALVCELPVNRLYDLCSKMPLLQSQFMRIIGSRIVSDQDISVLLSNRSATEKVAGFLVMMSQLYSALGYSNIDFNLTMSRQDIANFLGLALETVSRQLTNLSKIGVITIKHRGVQINNLAFLRNIVEPANLSAAINNLSCC